MANYLQILKERSGDNFLGIVIPTEDIQTFLTQLSEILGESYDQFVELQQIRDMGKYFIEFLSISEFNLKAKEMGYDKFTTYISNISKVNIDDLKFIGLGSAEHQGNKSYFIVCKSNLLSDARQSLGLSESDLHVTIGFKWKDVEGERKNQLLVPTNNFLRTLKHLYYKEGESFEFIKSFSNFDLNIFKLIEPIKINETNAILRCGDNDYLQISLVDDRLTITGKWQDTNKLPILSDTLIEKKFKQIK